MSSEDRHSGFENTRMAKILHSLDSPRTFISVRGYFTRIPQYSYKGMSQEIRKCGNEILRDTVGDILASRNSNVS